ncbi:MAG: RNA 2',3'-cyclic phosphodiesterase [Candidatus Hodarchaeaceae archaeon]|nr:RNA 2',3'-cyclic phosphodiesterase [Candidatus Hodarchaeaceae archaeon]
MPRAFIAIDIEETVRQKLVDAQHRLAATGAQLKLVEPENIHVTMKFLGDVPDDKVGAIADSLRKAVAEARQFEIEVRGVGVFPDLRYMRVIWAGVAKGGDSIIAIQRNIDGGLRKLGFTPERGFVPHLTLARVKSAAGKEKLAELIKSMANAEFGTTRARAVELKRSTLTSKGPIYDALARIELG